VGSSLGGAAGYLSHSATEPQFKVQDSKFKRMQPEQFLVEPLRAAKRFANSSAVPFSPAMRLATSCDW
jgi:hypothetical protein